MRKQTTRPPRYGSYQVTRTWATPLPPKAAPADQAPTPKPPARWQTLWAQKPLDLPQGRALAVRHRDGDLEVAFVSKLTLSLRWEPLEKVLTPKQAKAWSAMSAFNRV